MKGSLQQLWGLIRGIQFTAFLAFINLSYPSNASSFLLQLMNIAGMDIFYGQEITNYFLNFSNQNILNDHFNNYGIGDRNFLNNTGSLIWPIFVGMILWHIITRLMNLLASQFYSSTKLRWLVIKVFPVDEEFDKNIMTYFIEAYTSEA